RQKSTTALFVNLSCKLLPRIDIRLISLHHPLGDVGPLDAAVLNSAVPAFAGQAILQLQVEIRRLASAPDAEDILPWPMVRTRLSQHHAVVDAPEIRVAIPALERLPVEDSLKSCFFEWRLSAATKSGATPCPALRGLLRRKND